MESIVEKIEKVTRGINEGTYITIAKIILSHFNNGDFKDQKTLAQESFVSISQITKFSKKIGYSGYRELMFELKKEYKHYDWNRNIKDVNVIEKLNSITHWISQNNFFIKEIVNELKIKETINIYSSYQVKHAANYIKDLFVSLNKNVRLISNDYRSNLIKNDVNDLNIIIICSADNDSLLKVWNSTREEGQKSFLIASERQRFKIDEKFEAEMILNYDFNSSKMIYRNIILELLFLHIFEKI
ncbi:hypothetical protein [Spiroplasma monobiae]|uniref:HTH rpiR-type domain-containing protein n=1 Tax=Spiroplasma monobiae MQ-1 TaxID=1336748 RepID=A0A2K9LUX5_SPISQ|nr:hypothetical protein [Spiroplasma monobiae]AUM62721.1 hypothetical protein SMONO_v1c04720 [Spiroplasma monobiae MQ-1]